MEPTQAYRRSLGLGVSDQLPPQRDGGTPKNVGERKDWVRALQKIPGIMARASYVAALGRKSSGSGASTASREDKGAGAVK